MPVRRCACGARVVVRSMRFQRCERGCVRLSGQSPRQPAPPPVAFTRVIRELRLLSVNLARQEQRGRRASARAVSLALEAVDHLKRAYPDRTDAIASALPWLEKRAGKASGTHDRAAATLEDDPSPSRGRSEEDGWKAETTHHLS